MFQVVANRDVSCSASCGRPYLRPALPAVPGMAMTGELAQWMILTDPEALLHEPSDLDLVALPVASRRSALSEC